MIQLLNSIAVVLLFFIAVVISRKWESLDLKNVAETIESVNNVLKFIGDLPKWLQFYSNLNANVQKLEDKQEILNTRLNDLKERVEEQERKTGKNRKKEVDHWLNCAKSKLTDVENILLEINQGTDCFSEFLYRAWWGNQVEKKIVEVNDLCGSGFFEDVLSPIREMGELPVTPLVGKAVNENIKTIMAWLENGVTLIGVHGDEGIGKTALLKHIYNQLRRNDKIGVYMVTIHGDCTDYQLQSIIANAVDMELREEDVLRRAAFLCRALKRKKFVLILDGLTKHFTLENVGIPLDMANGKMIIASRDPNVCRKMGCQRNSVALTPLLPDEALHLFKQNLHISSVLDSQLEVVASQIVEQCRGVALRIVEKASDLTGVDDLSEWQNVYDDMLYEAKA